MTEFQSVQQLIVTTNDDGQRLDNFLRKKLKGVPKSLLYRIIRKGQVRVNGGRRRPDSKVKEGDTVRVPPIRTGSRDIFIAEEIQREIESSVLFEDENFLVLNKPCGLAVHGGSGLSWGIIDVLRLTRQGQYVELAHRLDRDTSGCLLLAKNIKALRRAQDWFIHDLIGKRYVCLLTGRLDPPDQIVDAPLSRITSEGGESRTIVDPKGKRAITDFRTLVHGDSWTYAEARIHTGRTHQIRVHAAHLGCAVAGDRLYGRRQKADIGRRLGLKRLFLHCAALELPEGRLIEAPIPGDLSPALETLHQA